MDLLNDNEDITLSSTTEWRGQTWSEVADKAISLIYPMKNEVDCPHLRKRVAGLLEDNFPGLDIEVCFEDHEDEGTAIVVHLPSPITRVAVCGPDGKLALSR